MSRRQPRSDQRRSCERCGYDRTYQNATEAEADRWFRKHACQKRIDSAVRSQQHQQRMALVDRTPKVLTGTRQHGTYSAYTIDACRCYDCARAASEYEINRQRQKAYGRWTHWVDAEPVRAHVRELQEYGIGWKRTARLAGVSQSAVWKLLYGSASRGQGPSQRVLRRTAEAIYAVQPTLANMPPRGKVPSHGATLRVRALVALGWSQAQVAQRLGLLPGNTQALFHEPRARITVQRYRDVVALYDVLSMTLPPQETHRQRQVASRARTYAKRHGWKPPLALDDGRLDDPTYRPGAMPTSGHGQGHEVDHAKVERRIHGERSIRLNHAEAAEAVRRLRAQGFTGRQMELMFGLKPERYGKEEAS